jgi:hypothetical protein
MTTIHTGNTITTGFVVTSDATGNLVIKTGGAGGTTALTVGADQRVSFAQPPLTAIPIFRAKASANQTVTTGLGTKVELPVVDYDTSSWFDNTTDYRYTPQIAGYYFFRGLVVLGGTSMTNAVAYVYKNGAQYTLTTSRLATSAQQYLEISTTVYLNGTTDFVELWGFVSASSGTQFHVSPGNESWATSTFEGFLVRPA